MLRGTIILVLISVGFQSFAQTVTRVSKTRIRFSDPAYGVCFLYPANWDFTTGEQEGIGLGIAYENDPVKPSPKPILRALVSTNSIRGVRSRPVTNFIGAEFAYDGRPATSADACRILGRDSENEEAGQVTIQGITYWHGTSGGAAAGTSTEEDIYTTFVDTTGSCLRFDLSSSYSNVTTDRGQPHALSPHEHSLVRATLLLVLRSVNIHIPSA